ncbi:MAG: hypothetical protein ACK5QH_01730 [Rubrivivax sp.]
MNVQQMSSLRAWHVRHRDTAPMEYHVWDAVLTVWLMAWMGLPAALLLLGPWAGAVCVPLMFLPGVYVAWRTRLHRRRWLRCDWLAALQ